MVIDHLGLKPTGFDTLVRLVERGVYVKASGFGRVTLEVGSSLRALCDANPQAVVFGTDLPSTRAKRPFRGSDVDVSSNGWERRSDGWCSSRTDSAYMA